MNIDFGGAIKIACACAVATSVAVVAATTPIVDTFFNCGATDRSSRVRRRRNNRNWSLIQKELIGNQDGDVKEIENCVKTSLGTEFERNASRRITEKTQEKSHIKKKSKDAPAEFIDSNLLEKLHCKQTSMGFTLEEAIKYDSDGKFAELIAGDQEAYSVLSDIYEPVISAESPRYKPCKTRYPFLFDPTKLSDLLVIDSNKFISSIHFMLARSIKEYKFLPCSTAAEKLELEEVMSKVFDDLPYELRVTYESLGDGMHESYEGRKEAAGPNFVPELASEFSYHNALYEVLPTDLHKKTDCGYYDRAGINRDWPAGRGVFTRDSGSTKITVNRDDHIRIYHAEQSGDLVKAFGSMCEVYRAVQSGLLRRNLHFAYDSKYGFVNWSPSMIGSSMVIAVNIRLPLLQKHERFQALLSECSLRCDRVNKIPEEADILQLTLTNTYGLHEVEMMEMLTYGLRRLIKLEKLLQRGTCTTFDMPSDYSYYRSIESDDFAMRKCARLDNMNIIKNKDDV